MPEIDVIGRTKEPITRDRISRDLADLGVTPGELHGDPAFHAPALYDDNFRSQRRRQWGADDTGQSLGQNFHAVADMDMETGHTGILGDPGTIVKQSGEQIDPWDVIFLPLADK